jgi:hypothetical protein
VRHLGLQLSGLGRPGYAAIWTRIRSHVAGLARHPRPPPPPSLSARPSATERLANPAAFLSRSDLRELGLERRAVDAVFRALPVVALPGYSRPLIRVQDYLELVEASTYDGDRVRPT